MKRFLLLVIAGTGIAILFWGCSVLEQSREALSWPQTKGKMISSLLSINHLPKFIDRRDDPARWYGADIQYEYSVGDNTYISSRLSFQRGDSTDPKEALKAMNNYRWHHHVIVYYNPKDPRDAVLEPGDIGDIFLPLIIGALLAFFGLSSLYNQPLRPNSGVDSHIYQGHIYQNQGKLEEALWQYNQVIRVNPDRALGYTSRGSLFLERQNWDQAINDFNRAIAIDPNNALVYFTLGQAYLGKKEYDKAWVNMHKAMDKGFNVKPEILENIKEKLK